MEVKGWTKTLIKDWRNISRRRRIDTYLNAKSRHAKARVKRVGKKLVRNRTRIWNWTVGIFSIIFLLGAVYNLPNSPFPNSYNTSVHRSAGNAQFPATYGKYETIVNLTIGVVGKPFGNEIVAEAPLTLAVAVEINETFAAKTGIQKVIVKPDNAFEYPSKAGQVLAQYPTPCETPQPGVGCWIVYFVPRSSNLILTRSESNPVVWQGQQDIIYDNPGVYGATVELVTPNTTLAYHANDFFSINSQDYAIARRNETLTTSLTYFILFFAAVDVRRKSD